MSDPFGDDHNPFADVEDYNPFVGSSRPSVVVNETQPAAPYSPPTYTNNSSSNYGSGDSSVIRLEEDSDSDEDPYFGGKNDNPYAFDAPTTSCTSNLTCHSPSAFGTTQQSTSRGVVSIHTSEAKEEDGDYSMWQIEFYQQYFRVDSSEVGWRCLRSMWPFKVDFINFVSTNPDFYGPLWITTTLIFMMAACANFADYLYDMNGWKYDFVKLTVGTGIIYGFALGVPFCFWLYFKWVDFNISLIEILCIYGYSLFIYIPVSIVCIAPFNPVQWAAISIGCGISTLFLIVNMWNPLKSKVAHAIPLMVVMAALHVGIGITFMLYYFQFRHSAPTPVGPSPVPPAPTPI